MKPTVGRKVYFYASAGHRADCDAGKDQPLDATIIFVHGSDSVNIQVVGHQGDVEPILGCAFQGLGMAVPTGAHAAWMPYQSEQASRVMQSQAAEADPEPIPADPIPDTQASLDLGSPV